MMLNVNPKNIFDLLAHVVKKMENSNWFSLNNKWRRNARLSWNVVVHLLRMINQWKLSIIIMDKCRLKVYELGNVSITNWPSNYQFFIIHLPAFLLKGGVYMLCLLVIWITINNWRKWNRCKFSVAI